MHKRNTRKKSYFYFTLIVMSLITIWPFIKFGKTSADVAIQNIDSCEVVIPEWIKANLKNNLDSNQVIEIVRNLDEEGTLPNYYVTKREARALGWTPGRAFNEIENLKGKSIGGDHFGDFEKRLPRGRWKEADLEYKGEKRNAKRILFNNNGRKFVTIDHYETFVEVPKCK
ncbi:ribonuclease [Taylorella equigenitalis]|nr:ribonuclease [Taylorella equigenitalis]KOS58601.1 ribonuclease [Taylorella equigenitalis]WDU53849.1 ribonuclease [Taylorella equigenitalis]WDU55344.1 ribonuclease [Taylorella equigenitalis]